MKVSGKLKFLLCMPELRGCILVSYSVAGGFSAQRSLLIFLVSGVAINF